MLHMHSSLEHRTREFGREIFGAIGRNAPPTFSKRYWSSYLMQWSMARPEFKTQLFRFVDVLPTLKSSRAVMEHVREYLSKPLAEMHPALGLLTKLPPRGPQARFGAAIMRVMVRAMARQYIAGEDVPSALATLRSLRGKGMAFTVDLLGEYTVSEVESLEYLRRYDDALAALSEQVPHWSESRPILANHPGERHPINVSVKLSALYSQTSPLNFARSVEVLSERLGIIARRARDAHAHVYVDAEDSASNPIIYEVFQRVYSEPDLRSVAYPGVVVQAYARSAEATLRQLLEFAARRGAPIAVRLVKGAYVDYENAIAAQNGLPSPLFEDKRSADANFERLATLLLDQRRLCLPAFGSHNVRSLAHACCYAESQGIGKDEFELQMLYGMAEPIAKAFRDRGYLVRLYVPLGKTIPGMGYLVRRLLENTSNESFLRHTFAEHDDIDLLLSRPSIAD